MKEYEKSLKIKQKILDEFKANDRKGLYALTQKLMAYNSNKIEGSTLNSEQTASLFDTGTIVSNGVEVYKAKDIEETTGHFKMFNEMLKRIDEPVSSQLIKSFHYQLKNGVFEDLANGYPIGEYKTRANVVSDIQTSRPENVSAQIEALIDEYNNSNKSLEDIAYFHAEYEHIHPFQDGNGRTGRMIMLKQCFDNGLIPIIIKDDDKHIYYRALHIAQVDGVIGELTSFFKKCQRDYLAQVEPFIEGVSQHRSNLSDLFR